MKIAYVDTIIGTPEIKLTIIPRIFPNEGDVLDVRLRNELTDEISTPTNSFAYTNNYFELTIDNSDDYFQVNQKYELLVYRNANTIYHGKVICLSVNTDIQNYQHAVITNKKIQF